MRHLGCGVGLLDLQARVVEELHLETLDLLMDLQHAASSNDAHSERVAPTAGSADEDDEDDEDEIDRAGRVDPNDDDIAEPHAEL